MTSTPWLLVPFQACNPSMDFLSCYSSHSPVLIPKRISSKTLIRASMDSSSSSEPKKAPNSVSFTSKVNKVYEDKSLGILCYTDESGELICEGLDEGPRLTWQDMERINKEKTLKAGEDCRERILQISGRVDWSRLQAVVNKPVSMGEELKK